MKRILIPFLLLLSTFAYSQTNTIVKALVSMNADSATIKNNVTSLQYLYGDLGALYYNKQSNKWRIFSDSTWFDLDVSGGGGGGTVLANNGLSLSGDTVQLGGDLTTLPVEIGEYGGGPVIFMDTDFMDFSLLKDDPIGVTRYTSFNSDMGILETGIWSQSLNFSVEVQGYGVASTKRFNIDTLGNISMPNTKNFDVYSDNNIYYNSISGTQVNGRIGFYSGSYLNNSYNTFDVLPDRIELSTFKGNFNNTLIGGNLVIKTDDQFGSGVERLSIDSVGNISMPNTNSFYLETGNAVFDISTATASFDHTTGGGKNGGWLINDNSFLVTATGGTFAVNTGIQGSGLGTQRMLIDSVGNISMPNTNEFYLNVDAGNSKTIETTVSDSTIITSMYNTTGIESYQQINFRSSVTGDGGLNIGVAPDGNGTYSYGLQFRSGTDGTTFGIVGAIPEDGIGAGGGISIAGGNAGSTSGNTNGGNVTLIPGLGNGSGKNGSLGIADGTNQNMGISTLVGGTVTVNNNIVTANSRIFLTSQVDGGTPGFVRVSSRVAGTSFTITSSSGTDTSQIAWLIIEPN